MSGLVLIHSRRAHSGAFSSAIKTGLWKGPQRGHGIESALFFALAHAAAMQTRRET